MKAIKKILVPTDFSENAALAYQHAREIAQRFGAKIDLIHIIPTFKYLNKSLARIEAPLDITDEELYPKLQEQAQIRMQKAMDKYLSQEVKGEAIVHIDRKPSITITETAQEKGYDLIVISSKGSHKSNLLRGSTTEKIIRHSEIPVFTVDADLSPKGLKRILLPTDGSLIAFSALPIALSLADSYDAEITLYHVEELYGSALDYEGTNPNKTAKENTYATIIERLEQYLSSESMGHVKIDRAEGDFEDQFVVTEGASSHRINFFTVIEKGVSAHLGIEEYAAENADVVVMTTHGHSGLAHFFLGSTTEKVAQLLKKPVVTVKPSGEKLKEK